MRAVFAVYWAALPGLALALAGGVPAHGSPTADQARSQLDVLYARAAESARQFEAAQGRLAAADAAVRQERRAALQAKAERAKQSAAVAALTIQQLQNGSGVEQYSVLLSGAGRREYLERAAAYASTAEAMNATIDELSARTVVHEAEQRRLETALQRQRSAMVSEASARNAINAAIAESKRQTRLAAQAFEDAPERESPRSALRAPDPGPPPPAEGEQPEASVPPSASPAPPAAPPDPPAAPPAVPPASPPAVPPASPPATSTPPASSEPYGVWDKIAKCESGGRWHINTGNGYYGGLQFSYRTWRGVGGPGYPHEQSREVQIHYAKILQARYGWGQWSCAWARFT